MAEDPAPKPRGFSPICLPISQERYQQVIDSPALFRHWLDEAYRATPELFPAAFASGYTLKDARVSAKRGLPCAASAAKPRAPPFPCAPASSCRT